MGWFFEQWLYKPGTLKVNGTWTYDAAARQVRITLDQMQTDGNLFTMPVQIGVYSKGQPAPAIARVQLSAKANVFTIDAPTEPEDVRLDPNVWVLMDASFEKKR